MSTTNRTSQAVREETNLAPRYKAICEKYLRMEKALNKMVETCGHDKFTDNCDCKVAREALAFDPLLDWEVKDFEDCDPRHHI